MTNYNYKEGRHSEYIARFILSRFSYISEPPNPSEDPGIDFYCTYFNLEQRGNIHITRPAQSYVIQIKSFRKNQIINLVDYKQLLNTLELPFFIGIINRDMQTLKIYAGIGIPILFSIAGTKLLDNPKCKFYAELVENLTQQSFFISQDEQEFILKFPLVANLSTNFSYKTDPKKLNKMYDVMRIMQNNISSWISKEYIFNEYNPLNTIIIAGPGSAETYLENFHKRLAEALYNNAYMNSPKNRNKYANRLRNEFEIFGLIHNMIKSNFVDIPPILSKAYQKYIESNDTEYPDPGDSSTGLTGASEVTPSNDG